ncbi:Dehydrogenase/reductase SDR family member 12 [Cladophialophora carrionii]|uniref:Dehydrogenase/reductase SDR family member 12 n=1 Tax=Cladophialophora carrionii TaxID=86049 RepID=A0A1C1CF15_9EURO|nr:Dehydrogenase/reductase SDR family member 12 [Cladophialophora carrionii]
MVSLSDVHLNNTSLRSAGSGPTVALVGATAGIGLATFHALLKHTSSPTIYLVGRDGSRLDALIATAQQRHPNPGATIVPIVVVHGDDLTLVRHADAAARQIASLTSRLDLLIMSPGYLSFRSTADFSADEGLDRITSIRYHARMRFLVTLLPALRAAPNPRVISVLAAGKEGPLRLDDLGMTRPETYGPIYAAGAAASMTTLFFEELVATGSSTGSGSGNGNGNGNDNDNDNVNVNGNDRIVFVHLFPGLVGTGLRVLNSGWALSLLWEWIVRPAFKLFGSTAEDAGERVLFAATSGRFRRVRPEDADGLAGTLVQRGSTGVLGSGVYLVGEDSEVVRPPRGAKGDDLLAELRRQGAGKKVYEYTMAEFERIEKMGSQQ